VRGPDLRALHRGQGHVLQEDQLLPAGPTFFPRGEAGGGAVIWHPVLRGNVRATVSSTPCALAVEWPGRCGLAPDGFCNGLLPRWQPSGREELGWTLSIAVLGYGVPVGVLMLYALWTGETGAGERHRAAHLPQEQDRREQQPPHTLKEAGPLQLQMCREVP
jgi:hypothetical protein